MVQIHVSNEQVDLTAKYRNRTKKIYTHMTFRPINGHCQMQLEHNQIIMKTLKHHEHSTNSNLTTTIIIRCYFCFVICFIVVVKLLFVECS